jgi:NAD-dependent dihydropyrimidine dehydrogenase PreA subunit
MTYIIAEPCIDVKDKSCVDVCPVDCIHEFERILIIDPEAAARNTSAVSGQCPPRPPAKEADAPPDRERRPSPLRDGERLRLCRGVAATGCRGRADAVDSERVGVLGMSPTSRAARLRQSPEG